MIKREYLEICRLIEERKIYRIGIAENINCGYVLSGRFCMNDYNNGYKYTEELPEEVVISKKENTTGVCYFCSDVDCSEYGYIQEKDICFNCGRSNVQIVKPQEQKTDDIE